MIHRDASRIGQYKRRTAELIGQLRESIHQNEALIASRKKRCIQSPMSFAPR